MLNTFVRAAALTAGLFALTSPAFAMSHGDHGDKEELKDIVDTAVAADGFETLVQLVTAAELVEALKGEGPFTVFAPTDEAFAALPAETVAALTAPEGKEKLQAILKYHVVSGKFMAADLAGKTLDVETLQGGTVAVDATDGVKINDATVVAADVKTSNGVIHAIDTVLMPAMEE